MNSSNTMSFTPATTQTHEALVRALAGKSGEILSNAQIRQLVEARVPEIGNRIQWLFPSDHCDNHVVKGSCRCAGTPDAPLSRVGHGRYLVRSVEEAPNEPPESPQITLADFLQTVADHEGDVLKTIGGNATFTMMTAADGVDFTPASSGNQRHVSSKYLSDYLKIYNETGSLQPKTYAAGLVDSSYVLAIIRLWLEEGRQGVIPSSAEPVDEAELDDAFSAEEGAKLVRVHHYKERRPKLTQKAKAHFKATHSGRLFCEVCEFDFGAVYGEPDFIEAHHRTPLRDLQPGTLTKLSDLAMVCANCHRMLHRGSPWPTVEELKVKYERLKCGADRRWRREGRR
jgi:hypothetical protein